MTSTKDTYHSLLQSTTNLDKSTLLNRLVLNFLIHEGYEQTAYKLAKELGINPNGSEEDDEYLIGWRSMSIRRQIKDMLLKGEIGDAIDTLNLLYPELLEQNNLLYFKLLLLNLIEMIRNHEEQGDGDDKEQFIMKIVSFAQDKLTNKAIKNIKFMEELELTMTLLIYSNKKEMLPPKLNQLFEIKLRRDIASLVNKCILQKEATVLLEEYNGTLQNHETHGDEDEDDGLLLTNQIMDSKLNKLMRLWVWLENKTHVEHSMTDIPLFKLDET